MPVLTEIERLELRVEDLEEEVAFLRHALGMMEEPPSAWCLNNQEARLWGRFLMGGIVRWEALMDALYDFPDYPLDKNIIKVVVHGLRRKIKRHGIEIETRWALGYELPRDMIDKYRQDWPK